MQADLDARRTTRDIDLKARQMGITTYKVFRAYHNATTRTDWNVLIMGHEENLPQVLLGKIRLAWKFLPEEFKPRLEYNTKNEMTFPDFRSSITVGTGRVQKKMSGAKLGRTYQELLITEAADPAWEDDVIKMLLQTVPDGGIVSMESTPKGRRGYFYEQWQAAKEGTGEFAPHFYPWWWDDGYVVDVPYDFAMSDEERRLADTFGLSPQQVAWRRKKIAQIGEQTFREQYPENDIDCFLFSGQPFFSQIDIVSYIDGKEFCKDWPTWTGSIQTNPQTGEIERVESSYGRLKVFRWPEKGHHYIIGADVAENVKDGDYSCAEVIDSKTCEQMAEWHGHIDPDLFAYVLADLGKLYNQAHVVCESNSAGHTTCNMLAHRVYYQPLFYHERITGQVNYDKPGWLTGSTNRGPMVHLLSKHMREFGSITPHSTKLMEECLTFVCDPTKRGEERYAAESGCRDDRVMAFGIALSARESTQCVPIERGHQSSLGRSQRERDLRRDDSGKSTYESWFMDGR